MNGLTRGVATEDHEARALDFLMRHGEVFGLRNAGEELNLQRVLNDRLGETHLTYSQRYEGVPVFGAFLKAHFDASGELRVVNGDGARQHPGSAGSVPRRAGGR